MLPGGVRAPEEAPTGLPIRLRQGPTINLPRRVMLKSRNCAPRPSPRTGRSAAVPGSRPEFDQANAGTTRLLQRYRRARRARRRSSTSSGDLAIRARGMRGVEGMRRWVMAVGGAATSVAMLFGMGMIESAPATATSSLPVLYNGVFGYTQASRSASAQHSYRGASRLSESWLASATSVPLTRPAP
jgi:hypothetical protein